MEIKDERLLQEIEKAVKNIVEKGETQIEKETCRLCKLMMSKGFKK